MGKKSGPKAPPPPPDYAPQRDRYVKTVGNQRDEVASDYNQAINYFNEQLGGLKTGANQLAKQLSGLDINYGQSDFDSIQSQIDDYQSTLGDFVTGDVSGLNPYSVSTEPTSASLAEELSDPNSPYYDMDPEIAKRIKNMSFGPMGGGSILPQSYVDDLSYDAFGLPTAPNFADTGTSYGQSVSLATPTLNELNSAKANSILQNLADLESQLGGLSSQKEREQSRIDDYFKGYVDDFNRYDVDVGYDPLSTDFDKYMALTAQAQNELNSFDSLLDFSGNQAAAQKELDELIGIIGGRQDEKTAEQGRIDAFGTSLDDRLGALGDTIGGLGIKDVADTSSYEEQLEALRKEISGFDSDLDFNFGGNTSTAFELEDNLSDLQNKRAQEEARINAFQNKYESLLESGAKNVGRMDEYDLFALEDAQTDLDRYLKDIQGFESELDFDFADLVSGSADPQAVLDALLATRTEKLGKEQSDVDALLAGITDIADYDEGSMNRLRDNLIDELGDLNRFSGGLGSNRDSIEGGLESVDDLLDALQAKRGGIESDALEALQTGRDTTFNTLDDVAATEAILNEILGQSEKYKATQATDELDLLAALLGDERGRIQSDMDTVQSREDAARAEVEPLLDAYGNLLFPNVADGAQDIVSEEQLRAYLANLEDDDELQNLAYNSSFARNLLAEGV